MSRILQATLPCPNCGKEFEATLFTTIRAANAPERALVFNDEAIKPTCTHCGHSVPIANLSIYYHDATKGFALWYEPVPDPAIDAQMEAFKKGPMGGGYLANAARISDWEEFKATILKYESGELKAEGSDELMKYMEDSVKRFLESANKPAKKSSGCMLLLGVVFTLSTGALWYLMS